MTKLEKKLIELGYELSMTQTIYGAKDVVVIKTYCKEVNNDFNFINICGNKIYKINASNENEMKKDLEVLKNVESEG